MENLKFATLNFAHMGIIYVIFIEHCTKCYHLPALKGNNSYKKVIKCLISESC